jgi:hypothetical protein
VPPAIAPMFCFLVGTTFVVALDVVLDVVKELGAGLTALQCLKTGLK